MGIEVVVTIDQQVQVSDDNLLFSDVEEITEKYLAEVKREKYAERSEAISKNFEQVPKFIEDRMNPGLLDLVSRLKGVEDFPKLLEIVNELMDLNQQLYDLTADLGTESRRVLSGMIHDYYHYEDGIALFTDIVDRLGAKKVDFSNLSKALERIVERLEKMVKFHLRKMDIFFHAFLKKQEALIATHDSIPDEFQLRNHEEILFSIKEMLLANEKAWQQIQINPQMSFEEQFPFLDADYLNKKGTSKYLDFCFKELGKPRNFKSLSRSKNREGKPIILLLGCSMMQWSFKNSDDFVRYDFYRKVVQGEKKLGLNIIKSMMVDESSAIKVMSRYDMDLGVRVSPDEIYPDEIYKDEL